MVKGNPKSSATSATRKKHLKKHAAADEPPPKEKRPKNKGEKGKKKAEPRVKMYIPPVKPAPVQPDLLETTGLAHSLPADLLIVLRNISKKAQVTKTRALEELQSAWVNQCLKEGSESLITYTLVEMLPVWLHHISALLVNASRRVRLLAVSVHSTLLQIPPVREQIIFFLRESTSSSQLENILGTWCLSMHDVDRTVASTASRSWRETITNEESASSQHLFLSDGIQSSLNSFVQRVILDPCGVYNYLNPLPPPPPAPVTSTKKGPGKVSTPRKDDGDQTPRSKQEEQEESELDRKARLRIGALGAARWILASSSTLSQDSRSFYSNPALWTILHPAQSCPWIDVENFGFAQPNVRKSGWSLVQTLITTHKDHLEILVSILGIAILRSAWVEMDTNVQGVMWEPLLVFLKQYPQCWTLDEGKANEAEDSGSEADSDADPGEPTSVAVASSPPAFLEFLQFLRLGCSGSPVQGYPAVVVVISTIPSSILASDADPSIPPLSQFFTAFWEAVESRALSSLHRVSASAAFLSSLLESVTFLIKRIRNTSINVDSNGLVREQFQSVWEHLSSQKLKVGDRAAARLLAQTLEALHGVDQPLFDAAWDVLVSGMKTSSAEGQSVELISAVLKVFYDRFKKTSFLAERIRGLITDILDDDLTKLEKTLKGAEKVKFELVVSMLDQFREGLFLNLSFANRLDALLSQHSYRILELSSPLLLTYILHRNNEDKVLGVWHSLLASVAATSVVGHVPDQHSIGILLEAAQKGKLPKYLKPQATELDGVVGGLLEEVLGGSMGSDEVTLVEKILSSADYFLSATGVNTFLQIIIATFTSNVHHVVNSRDGPEPNFDTAIHLIQTVFARIRKETSLLRSLLPDVFLLGFLCPHIGNEGADITPSSSETHARNLWMEWLNVADEDEKLDISNILKERLRGIVENISVNPTPEDVLDMVSEKPPGLQMDLLQELFPNNSQLNSMLNELSPDSIDPSIAILDPLIPPASTSKSTASPNAKFTDRRGFNLYARIVSGILHILAEERQLAKQNLWALRHIIALSLYARDLSNMPSALSRSPVFSETVTSSALLHIIGKAKQLSVYLFNSAEGKDDPTYRRVVLDRLLHDPASKDPREGLNQLQTLLFNAISYAEQADTTRDARILKLIMEPLLADDIEVAEADLWVQLGRKLERSAPQTSMTIISVATSTGAEPPKLDRYRNELAANLLGIKPGKVNTEGLLTLRKLVACAPDPEGEVVFLPPPRAVNVVKACQAWVLADVDDDEEELEEDVQSAMLPIFTHLAPILQNVPGSHWPFIFDVVEAVLETSSGESDEAEEHEVDDESNSEEGSKLVGLARALRLVIVLEDLAKLNKGLMAEWSERRLGILTTIRDLKVISHYPNALSSTPRSVCRQLVLSIVQDLPSSLIDQDTLAKMCHLIDDRSLTVQKMAYQLLKSAARTRTEYFVIEAGVDTDATVQATLPAELLDVITRQMNFELDEEDGGEHENIFGYLLGWLLVFDLFQDASFKVKSNYIEQLRNLNIVVDHLIPCFLGLLRLNLGSLTKAFKLDIWAVDQFYVDLYEPGNPHTIPVLAAHVYYRALLSVPSLIHSWILDCKDRQLTNTVTAYTSTHFSPVLIKTELEHVRSHAVLDGIADDSMSIKVATAINEVVAAYLVDEHQLEIKLRIPGDWPLHKIEVRDVKQVGVDENRWRAWVLGVQQTIWSHNGRIIDGLGIFKKNVTLHFEGQVECAICYSIISVMDGSLPKKPCKTCKNRFHAGCLYKWFNSSHSSSCPLCRSDII